MHWLLNDKVLTESSSVNLRLLHIWIFWLASKNIKRRKRDVTKNTLSDVTLDLKLKVKN